MTAPPLVAVLDEVGEAHVALVGGKGARLGALCRVAGVRVPPGFCVTTEAFRRAMAAVPSAGERLDRLARLDPADHDGIRTASAALRQAIEAAAVPDNVADAISGALTRLGRTTPCAVRSSATAEDLPTASFAGQQDTYLNIAGPAAVLHHVRRCWASLFTERAVAYRLRSGIDHRGVAMGVVVQRLVTPRAAGVLCTADPVTSNRRVTAIEATFGLGEALVGGRVRPDVATVRDGAILTRTVATKQQAVEPSPGGGTRVVAVEAARQHRPALSDVQVLELARLGREVEAHFGAPQDIEWCLAADGFWFVQSRPITTLFPVPPVSDQGFHVYVSVGHQQMMTDAMKPLGLSIWQRTTPRPMCEAGGRLFVDVTQALASPSGRAALLDVLTRADPLIGDALATLLDRGAIPPEPTGAPPPTGTPHPPGTPHPGASPPPVAVPGSTPVTIDPDPSIVAGLVDASRASLLELERGIRGLSGTALLEYIAADIEELRRILFDPRSIGVIVAGMQAAWWLDDHAAACLGETHVAGALTQSVPHNVTSEMGLALLDVADAVRPHPEVVAFLERAAAEGDEGFLDALPQLAGGGDAREAIGAYLDAYGMRCVGEIDITRPRWRERPTALVPMILADVRSFEAGARERRFEQGRRDAAAKERDLLARLGALPGGEQKAGEAKAMIDRLRTFAGYREYPKYHMVSRYLVYKRALLEEAGRLVRRGVLQEEEDLFFLRFEELPEVLRTGDAGAERIRARKDAFGRDRSLSPPRVLTSDGEVVAGAYRRDGVPAGALVGLPVSAGTVEGRARVVLDMAEAALGPGDILVTTCTDPSWTPAFVTISALVTEVGGQMTHGAVIAREYGLPAVVGVEHATQRIRDGQRIRVDGAAGTVELLADGAGGDGAGGDGPAAGPAGGASPAGKDMELPDHGRGVGR